MLEINYQNVSDLESILMDFKILFAYHSNKIENDEINYHDTREVFENGKVVGFSGDPRTLFEIQNQKVCYQYLLNILLEKKPIDIELIKKIHLLLTNGTYDELRYSKGERPGEFKIGEYIVGKNEIGSLAKDVEKDLLELLDEINNVDVKDYLTVVSYFHLRFEQIHPFTDGNGRVGRTLLNYYLMINGYKPLIVYDEDKKLYYECLRVFDESQDIEPMKKFLEYEQEKTWTKKKQNKAKLVSFL